MLQCDETLDGLSKNVNAIRYQSTSSQRLGTSPRMTGQWSSIPAKNRPDTCSRHEPTCYETTLVEIAGIEPATSGLQSRRSPN